MTQTVSQAQAAKAQAYEEIRQLAKDEIQADRNQERIKRAIISGSASAVGTAAVTATTTAATTTAAGFIAGTGVAVAGGATAVALGPVLLVGGLIGGLTYLLSSND